MVRTQEERADCGGGWDGRVLEGRREDLVEGEDRTVCSGRELHSGQEMVFTGGGPVFEGCKPLKQGQ